VHVTSLESDYFKFDAGRQQLVGERSGRRYSLGEPMRVQVQRVDMDTRRIDFRPLRDDTGPERSGRRR
jgi:ribonuclease R